MDELTHILDPEGEVVIVLSNPNPPFAVWNEELVPNQLLQDYYELAVEVPTEKSPDVPVQQPADEVPEMPIEAEARAGEPIESPVEATIEEPHITEFIDGRSDSEHSCAHHGVVEHLAYDDDAEQYESDKPLTESYRIQVSAKHLTLASPVFKKILRGGWSESVTFLQEGSVEIFTEAWDIEALLILLRVIHCQPNDIPRKLSLEMLAKVAVIADYYKCTQAMGFLDAWIGNLPQIPAKYSRDLILWLWISWVFQLQSQFNEVTSIAISQSPCPINCLALPVPKNVLEAIDDRRAKAIESILLHLYEERMAFLHNKRGCCFECRSIMHGALTNEMLSSGLYSPRPKTPFLGISYNQLVKRVLSFKSPQWYSSQSRYGGGHSCTDSSFEYLFGMRSESIEGIGLSSYIP